MSALLADVPILSNRTRWLLEHAAAGLGVDAPQPQVEELQWLSTVFSDSGAITLYLAARSLADAGYEDEALEVLGDACHAELAARPTIRGIPSRR